MNLIDLFQNTLQGHAGKPAICLQGRIVTFGEIDAHSNRIAHLLRRIGLERCDRVAFYLNNPLSS